MSKVPFPSIEEVEKNIKINRSVHQLAKMSFMNACNTNNTFINVRQSIIQDPKALKRMQWVQQLDGRVKQKIGERIKVIKQQVSCPITSDK